MSLTIYDSKGRGYTEEQIADFMQRIEAVKGDIHIDTWGRPIEHVSEETLDKALLAHGEAWSVNRSLEENRREQMRSAIKAARRHLVMTDDMCEFIEGMTVSVDVSTGDSDADHRLFGTIAEVMGYTGGGDKHGVTLLVQDAKPNFEPEQVTSEMVGRLNQHMRLHHGLHMSPASLRDALNAALSRELQ